MPRPKGSKNKKSAVAATTTAVLTVEELDAQIASTTAEIETIAAELKTKKAELKKLEKERTSAEKAAAAAKAEEDKARVLEAIAASGKSIDEVLELLKG